MEKKPNITLILRFFFCLMWYEKQYDKILKVNKILKKFNQSCIYVTIVVYTNLGKTFSNEFCCFLTVRVNMDVS